MIAVFSAREIAFTSLGLGAICPTSCQVSEELNGVYELTLSHPYDGLEKWKYLEVNHIVLASTPKGKQPFRIYKITPTMTGISIYARHIYFDLLDNYLPSLSVTSKSPSQTLTTIKTAFAYSMGFSFATNMAGTGSIHLEKVNPITAISGVDEGGSFLSVFGGELDRDFLRVNIMNAIGSDRGVVISYGKNLTGLKVEEDMADVGTRIYATGKDSISLPEKYIDSPHLGDYPYPKIYVHEDNNAENVTALRESVQALFEGGMDLPKINIQVDFQLLGKTEEFKKYAILEEVYLGDIVTVRHEKMNFHKKAKVISYSWNCLLEQYDKLELGDFVADITSSISSGEKAVVSASQASSQVVNVLGRISGNITIVDGCQYISLDHGDYTQSTRLFRWSVSGLQYSKTGYRGTWQTIIGTDGVVV